MVYSEKLLKTMVHTDMDQMIVSEYWNKNVFAKKMVAHFQHVYLLPPKLKLWAFKNEKRIPLFI